ncbi:hypothetical protein C0995_013410 [Termitomyces sp. Mi166|nr:hypothetical protein C0995_013410 [Termitomyces sp. Mi166\
MDSEESIIVLKNRHNSLSITSGLPDEILCGIFEVGGAMETDYPNRFNKKLLNFLLSISHVSSGWRHVALGSPGLWANLSIFDSWPRADCIDEILSRSSKVPLSIYVSLSAQPPAEKLRHILDTNLGRIRSLTIIMAPASRLESLLSGLTPSAPVLEHLHLQVPYERWNPAAALMVRNELFQGFVPNLRTLILRSCSVSVLSPLFLSSLTELTFQPMRDATPSLLLQILRLLPRLQTLMLGNLDDDDDQISEDMLPSIHLPELHKLILVEKLTGATVILLSHLTFPHDTSLEVNMPLGYHTMSAIIIGFGHALLRHMGDSQYLRMEHDIICCGFTLKAWPEFRDELDLPPPLVSLTISLSSDENEDQKSLISFLRVLFHSLQLERLEVLHVHNVGLDSSDWSSIFGALPMLRTIQIDSERVDADRSFIDALCTSANHDGDSVVLASGASINLPFKVLRIVIALYWDTSLDDLEKCLRCREAAGVPVRELQLINRYGDHVE